MTNKVETVAKRTKLPIMGPKATIVRKVEKMRKNSKIKMTGMLMRIMIIITIMVQVVQIVYFFLVVVCSSELMFLINKVL